MLFRTSRRMRRGVVALVLVIASMGRATGAPAPAPGPAPKPPSDFVDLADVAPDIAIDMRYAGAQNFLGRPVRKLDGRLAPDGSLNMGTTFDCLDERSHTDDAAASPAARQNRQHLRRAMQRRGFAPYAKEWWHFTLAQEPHPEISFDFAIELDGHKH